MIDQRSKQALKTFCKVYGAGSRMDYLRERESIAGQVRACSESGQVALVTGGMDCDCVQWEGRVTLLPAQPILIIHWIDDLYKYAEGPVTWRIATPTSTQDTVCVTRDRILEAYENGHPYSV